MLYIKKNTDKERNETYNIQQKKDIFIAHWENRLDDELKIFFDVDMSEHMQMVLLKIFVDIVKNKLEMTTSELLLFILNGDTICKTNLQRDYIKITICDTLGDRCHIPFYDEPIMVSKTLHYALSSEDIINIREDDENIIEEIEAYYSDRRGSDNGGQR